MPGLRNKYVAGNVCLLLFVAFLAMTAVGIVETGTASAQIEWKFEYKPDSLEYSKTQLKSAIWVSPLTSATEGPSLFAYYFRLISAPGGDKVGEVRLSDRTVIGHTYEAAYKNLLQLVYAVPQAWGLETGFKVTFKQVYHDVAQNAVYVDLLYEPPKQGGGGGGGGGAGPEQQIVSSDYGTIVVLPTLGSATYNVNESLVISALQSLAASVSQFTIADLSGTNVYEKATVIGSGILQAALNLAKDLVIDNGQVVVTLPSGFIDPTIVAQAGAGAAFRIVVDIMDEEAGVRLVSGTEAEDQGFVPQSTVFDLSASIVRGSEKVRDITRFDDELEVTFTYDPQPGIDEQKLGVYGLDPVTQTWVYAGGRVNPDSNQITAGLGHFSQYCVMLYDKTFADIATHWSKADVELMASRHVVKGVSETQFAPEAAVTRAQFAALLLRALGLEEYTPAMETFLDVSRNAWYFGAVEGAFRAGVIKGYEDGTFRPDARVTRQEMATMLVRALAKAGVDTSVTAADLEGLSAFADKGSIASWAADAVAYATRTGILKGRAAMEFAPLGTGTRAEAAVMMKRLMATTKRI